MKITVYTSLFGNYEPLADLGPTPSNFKLVCVSDREYKGWTPHVVSPPIGTSKYELTKSNRYYKLQPWEVDPDCDFNIYVDSNIGKLNWEILERLCEKLDKEDKDAMFFKHPRAGGKTLPEIYEVARQGKASLAPMMQQFREYTKEGFSDDIHIINANTQIRRTSSDELNNFLNIWWNEVKNKCHRDQISYAYSIWKSGFTNFILEEKEVKLEFLKYKQQH